MTNPKTRYTAHVLLFKGERVLLVKHTEGANHITGVFGIPGGKINDGEGIQAAAKRELLEETGLDVEINDLFEFPDNKYSAFIQKKKGKTYYTMTIFLAKRYKGELMESSETIPAWTFVDDITNINLLPNVDKAIMAAQKFLKDNK